jgi:hypothetical protein
MFLPFLRKIKPSLADVNAFNGFKPIKNLLDATIKEHRETFDSENIRDFIDAYIQEIKVIKSKFNGRCCEIKLVRRMDRLLESGVTRP